MLVWLKNSLTPQEIRERIVDPNSDFQKRIVEYLESVHMGEFIDTTMDQMFSSDRDDCDCANCASWWDYFTHTVNELLWRCNVHDSKDGGIKRRVSCKARFPRETRSITSVDPETGYLLLKKGEAWLNSFTPTLTYLLRSNSDVTCLLSGTAVKAVVAYVTDYITKSPLKTHTMFEALRTSFKKDSDANPTRELDESLTLL
ncbi:hypothetical protein PHLGIDRAFT_26855 [Phlebiopsis gigantea 11061_1 CR5-6]|uniref:Uncharacterized protein n=1 Tax=Phlebiopsis gigantea (strain 11061_1 CR5-6) TaxID=745531 RepID=A0A0C3PAJ0_PHLG1|nr:hypothetical protein PHLGIDRAFT_26855 [Phlebiopsis gigantea 11061_1 CR5-6]